MTKLSVLKPGQTLSFMGETRRAGTLPFWALQERLNVTFTDQTVIPRNLDPPAHRPHLRPVPTSDDVMRLCLPGNSRNSGVLNQRSYPTAVMCRMELIYMSSQNIFILSYTYVFFISHKIFVTAWNKVLQGEIHIDDSPRFQKLFHSTTDNNSRKIIGQ